MGGRQTRWCEGLKCERVEECLAMEWHTNNEGGISEERGFIQERAYAAWTPSLGDESHDLWRVREDGGDGIEWQR